MLATYYTLSKDSAPTPEEMRQKSREYMLMRPKKYSYSDNRNTQGGINHKGRHGTSPEFYSGLIIKIGARCFFCNQEGHFRMDCPLFWEAVKNQSHPKYKLVLAAVKNQRNRQGDFETKNLETPSAELPTKTVKAVTQVNSAIDATARNALVINYEKAEAEAINKVKQDLAAKEIEQRLKQEIERQKMKEALGCSQSKPEAVAGSTKSGNCNTVKMVTGKPFGITKIGARIMSIITVGDHEVTKNLSEPSDQTIMHIDVYADYLRV